MSIAEVQEGALELTTLTAAKWATELRKWLRLGYTKQPRANYLIAFIDAEGKEQWQFTERHPDLVGGGVFEDPILFVAKSQSDDMNDLTQQWAKQLERSVPPAMLASWIQQVLKATDYIVAPDYNPSFALVLADWAITHHRVLMCSQDGAPQVSPAKEPLAWENWIYKSYPNRVDIQRSLETLGWSLRDVLINGASFKQNLNSENGWNADTSEFAF